jgi:trigger factor
MQVTSEQPDPSTLILDIEVDEEQVSRTFDAVYREFSRHVNVPGFRPGKAPRAVVERYVNKDRVRERTREKLIQDTFFKALTEQEIQPYSTPEVDASEIEDKAPYAYKVTVPLEPQIVLGAYTGLVIDKPVFTVTDEIIDERIQALREEKARLERIADRGVEQGDVLIAEVQTAEEGEEEPSKPRRQLVQVGNNIPGFDDAILGMNSEETRTFELTYPDDYDDEAKRGKKVSYTLTVHSISAKRQPDLNDEFAQQVGADTVEALREKLRGEIQTAADQQSSQIAENRLVQAIHDAAELSYPRALVREELREDLNRLGEELRRYNVSYEKYLEQRGMTSEQLQASMAQQAEARVRTVLVLSKIAEMEGLQATDEDIDAEFDRLLETGRISEDQYDEYKPVRHRRIQVANALVQQRLHDYLFANSTFNEVVVTAPVTEEDEDDIVETVPAAEATEAPEPTEESAPSEPETE